MNLFDRNRNELSKYFYDLSKAMVISFIAIPFVQGTLAIRVLHVGVFGVC